MDETEEKLDDVALPTNGDLVRGVENEGGQMGACGMWHCC